MLTSVSGGSNAGTLGQGAVLVGTPTGGITKVSIGTDTVPGADLTIELQGNYATSDFAFSNSPVGANIFYAPPSSIAGTAGNDTLNGGMGADTIDGLAGNDYIDGNAGADLIQGGPGSDYNRFYSSTGACNARHCAISCLRAWPRATCWRRWILR